jgi:hypothetical protein
MYDRLGRNLDPNFYKFTDQKIIKLNISEYKFEALLSLGLNKFSKIKFRG